MPRPSIPGIEVSASVWMRTSRTQSPFSMITASSIPDHTKWGFIVDVHADEDKVQETTIKACEKRGVSIPDINYLERTLLFFLCFSFLTDSYCVPIIGAKYLGIFSFLDFVNLGLFSTSFETIAGLI